MERSRFYIIVYSAILTIVCGGLLALAAVGLKEKQQANIELERKTNILSTVMVLSENEDVEAVYAERVVAFVVDFDGNKLEMSPAEVDVAAEYKKPREQRRLPVYEFQSASEPGKVEYVVMPVYGYGLWNSIWGFVALKSDLNSIKGVKFEHAGETPGLGARITEDEVQGRYEGKTIFDGSELISVQMMKGEGNDYSNDLHKVDGLSGATLTSKGVNNMLIDYFTCYQKYLDKNRKNS